MSFNTSCFVPNCTELVVGQCPGYNKPCGNFFCINHSTINLCYQCASIYKKYTNYCEIVAGKFDKRAQYIIYNAIVGIIIGTLLGGFFKSFTVFCLLTIDWIIIMLTLLNIRKNQRLKIICKSFSDFKDFYIVWVKQNHKKSTPIKDFNISAIMPNYNRENQIEIEMVKLKEQINRMK
jgi:hypothetical protein